MLESRRARGPFDFLWRTVHFSFQKAFDFIKPKVNMKKQSMIPKQYEAMVQEIVFSWYRSTFDYGWVRQVAINVGIRSGQRENGCDYIKGSDIS